MNQFALNSTSESAHQFSEILNSQHIENSERSVSAELHPPKSFFGHQVTSDTALAHHYASISIMEEAEQLRDAFQSGRATVSNLPERIRALEGRAKVHALLAKEAEETVQEVPSNLSRFADQSPRVEEEASPEQAPLSDSTFLPSELPLSFFGNRATNNFYNLKRKQRQYLAAMTAHDENQQKCLREIRNKTKSLALLEKYRKPGEIKNLKQIIEQLKAEASYHTAMARTIHAAVYGYDSSTPGAHGIISEGNYEVEFPIRPPSPVREAQKVKQAHRDLIALPKTKAVPLAMAKLVPKKKSPPKKQHQLPVAEKVVAREVVATFPKNIRLPEAQARNI